MSMPDVEEFSEIHTDCTFCSGEYVVVQGSIRHSLPTCENFEKLPPLAFKKSAEDEARRQHASKR